MVDRSLLACLWAAPMIGIAKADFLPWWFAVCIGCLWCLVCAVAEPLYDWGVRIRRKIGLVRLADWSERMKPRLLPAARVALLIMALISFAAALL